MRTLWLEEDGFAGESPGTRGKMDYAMLRKVVYDKELTYVYVSSGSAHVIPDRAFAGAEEKAAFFAELERKMK